MPSMPPAPAALMLERESLECGIKNTRTAYKNKAQRGGGETDFVLPQRVWKVDQIERYRECKNNGTKHKVQRGVGETDFVLACTSTLFFCTLFFVLCFLYSVVCTLFFVLCFLCSVFCTLLCGFLYSVFCTLSLYSVFFSVPEWWWRGHGGDDEGGGSEGRGREAGGGRWGRRGWRY